MADVTTRCFSQHYPDYFVFEEMLDLYWQGTLLFFLYFLLYLFTIPTFPGTLHALTPLFLNFLSHSHSIVANP